MNRQFFDQYCKDFEILDDERNRITEHKTCDCSKTVFCEKCRQLCEKICPKITLQRNDPKTRDNCYYTDENGKNYRIRDYIHGDDHSYCFNQCVEKRKTICECTARDRFSEKYVEFIQKYKLFTLKFKDSIPLDCNEQKPCPECNAISVTRHSGRCFYGGWSCRRYFSDCTFDNPCNEWCMREHYNERKLYFEDVQLSQYENKIDLRFPFYNFMFETFVKNNDATKLFDINCFDIRSPFTRDVWQKVQFGNTIVTFHFEINGLNISTKAFAGDTAVFSEFCRYDNCNITFFNVCDDYFNTLDFLKFNKFTFEYYPQDTSGRRDVELPYFVAKNSGKCRMKVCVDSISIQYFARKNGKTTTSGEHPIANHIAICHEIMNLM